MGTDERSLLSGVDEETKVDVVVEIDSGIDDTVDEKVAVGPETCMDGAVISVGTTASWFGTEEQLVNTAQAARWIGTRTFIESPSGMSNMRTE